MKASRYNICFDCDDKKYVYNVRTQTILAIPEDVFELLNASKDISDFMDNDISMLRKYGFICDDETDEFAEILNERDVSRKEIRPFIRLLTTTSCICECSYCWQLHSEHEIMTTVDADRIIQFITEHYQDHNYAIEYFGGEPLCNAKIISYICDELVKKHCEYMTATMITNGLLFTPEIVKEATTKWKLSRVQVTLDGTPQEYNKVKANRIVSNPFETVIHNLHLLLDAGIKVRLRINVREGTEENIISLIDNYLIPEFKGKKKLQIYTSPMFRKGEQPKEMLESLIRINRHILDAGCGDFDTVYNMRNKTINCTAVSDAANVIGPKGELYFCSMNLEKKRGTIDKEDPKMKDLRNKFMYGIEDKCIDCILFPKCQGGCKAGALDLADIGECWAWKPIIKDVLREKVRYTLKDTKYDD